MAFVRFIAKPEHVDEIIEILAIPGATITERIPSKQEKGMEIVQVSNNRKSLPAMQRAYATIMRKFGIRTITCDSDRRDY